MKSLVTFFVSPRRFRWLFLSFLFVHWAQLLGVCYASSTTHIPRITLVLLLSPQSIAETNLCNQCVSKTVLEEGTCLQSPTSPFTCIEEQAICRSTEYLRCATPQDEHEMLQPLEQNWVCESPLQKPHSATLYNSSPDLLVVMFHPGCDMHS